MKRIVFCLMLLTGISVAFLLVSHTSAVGGPPFSNEDLSGEYIFNLVEIRTQLVDSTLTTNYCDVAGTLNFDGIDTVTLNATLRCSVTGIETPAPFTRNYTVNPDGSFVIIEPVPAGSPPDLVHGQIVNDQRSLLIDGTMRTNSNVLMFHGVAMQR